MDDIIPGTLLISDPFLKDPNFLRTVVLVCEHQFEGSFGFVLNKPYQQQLGDLISDLEGNPFPVFYGGPVQVDTIHFLHQRPDLLTGSIEVTNGVYWGGDFEEVVALVQQNLLQQGDIRFFIGYSGWGEGQLEGELRGKSWIARQATRKLVFHRQAEQIWREALKELGGEYEMMVNYPIDPQLN